MKWALLEWALLHPLYSFLSLERHVAGGKDERNRRERRKKEEKKSRRRRRREAI